MGASTGMGGGGNAVNPLLQVLTSQSAPQSAPQAATPQPITAQPVSLSQANPSIQPSSQSSPSAGKGGGFVPPQGQQSSPSGGKGGGQALINLLQIMGQLK